jgi:hypothetical protein
MKKMSSFEAGATSVGRLVDRAGLWSARTSATIAKTKGRLVDIGFVIYRGLAANFFPVVVECSLGFGFSGGFLRDLLLNALHDRLNFAFFVRLRTV